MGELLAQRRAFTIINPWTNWKNSNNPFSFVNIYHSNCIPVELDKFRFSTEEDSYVTGTWDIVNESSFTQNLGRNTMN